MLILLFLPVFLGEIYYVVSEKKPSERFMAKVVYINTITMVSLGLIGGFHFFLSAENPNPLMIFGTLIFFIQGGVVFLMMAFKDKFEERIMEFRVIYEQPPSGTLKVVLFFVVVPFLFFKFVFGMEILFAAFNSIGFPMIASMLMKWDRTHELYERLVKKFY
ncbi:MAG: hypothetical protein GON13_02640 [Nanoarchaeota archaeon]|nr:hypothetical protein [Nanoarchaeota archaeon]